MAKHVPTVIWSLRAPEYGANLRTNDEKLRRIVSWLLDEILDRDARPGPLATYRHKELEPR